MTIIVHFFTRESLSELSLGTRWGWWGRTGVKTYRLFVP